MLEEIVYREDFCEINWRKLAENILLTESFIREHKDRCKRYWVCICQTSKLSESFIREFKDEINWSTLVILEKISEKFVRENWNFIFADKNMLDNFYTEDPIRDKNIRNTVKWCLDKGIKII